MLINERFLVKISVFNGALLMLLGLPKLLINVVVLIISVT